MFDIMNIKERSIYIHIPFCTQKCSYCDFHSYPIPTLSKEKIYRYINALLIEIKLYKKKAAIQNLPISSIYFGGGTPSAIPYENILTIKKALSSSFTITKECEITIEANPETISKDFLFFLKEGGLNRVSLGVQSFHEKSLARLGRSHSSNDACRAVETIQNSGITNFSIDIIFGLVHQTNKEWIDTVLKVLSHEPPHISAYCLTVEGNTPFSRLQKKNQLYLPEEEVLVDMFNSIASLTCNNGYEQYEISNFSLPGYKCRHNMNYWHNGEYIGLGAAAHSHINGKRSWNELSLTSYINTCENGKFPLLGEERLTKKQKINETIMLAMRLKEGLPIDPFNAFFNIDFFKEFSSTIASLTEDGLIEMKNGSLIPTQIGLLFHNEISLRFS